MGKQNIHWRARCTSGNAVGAEIEMWLRDSSQNFKQPWLPGGLHVTARSEEKLRPS